MNPLVYRPGYYWNGNQTGIIGPAPRSGAATLATSTTVTEIGFNAQTAGNGGALAVGSLVELSVNGNAPDIVASVVSPTSITLLTATGGSGAATITAYPAFVGLITGEASALTSTSTLLSSYYTGASGVGGVVNQLDLQGATNGGIMFIAGGAFTPSGTTPSIKGWFMCSDDGGNNFDATFTNVVPGRNPDFTIALYTGSAYAAGTRTWAPLGIAFPPWPFKTLIANTSGVTLPSKFAIYAIPAGLQQQI